MHEVSTLPAADFHEDSDEEPDSWDRLASSRTILKIGNGQCSTTFIIPFNTLITTLLGGSRMEFNFEAVWILEINNQVEYFLEIMLEAYQEEELKKQGFAFKKSQKAEIPGGRLVRGSYEASKLLPKSLIILENKEHMECMDNPFTFAGPKMINPANIHALDAKTASLLEYSQMVMVYIQIVFELNSSAHKMVMELLSKSSYLH